MRVECLAQKDNTTSLARVQNQTTRFRLKFTNHEATVPPFIPWIPWNKLERTSHWSFCVIICITINNLTFVCRAISSHFVVFAHSCIASAVDYIVIGIKKVNHEKGY